MHVGLDVRAGDLVSAFMVKSMSIVQINDGLKMGSKAPHRGHLLC